MLKLGMFLLICLLISCAKDHDCKICFAVIQSNVVEKCGTPNNNTWVEVSRGNLGQFCGDAWRSMQEDVAQESHDPNPCQNGITLDTRVIILCDRE